ncbi:DC2L1-like protein [Mya arenaria]|uniref:Cytoplasmic dynein 2 light intermediate chain 1 n=1 Tax=Mya arenaria TaxID=6604 RepID=A0ABY7G850_MYAAR|nr:DC2L1-like protein [Mya arenaria]
MTTLWDLAIEQAGKDQDDGKNAEEKNLFIVGAKNSGKTSIILRFLERNEAPKPTVALEYTYARRSKGHNMAKDIGHIWELGGGTWLNGAVMICVDLSKPEEIWFTLESLLASSRARIEAAIADARQDNPGIREALQKRALARLGEDHADRNMLDPFPVPLVIVGTKYDLFQDMDSEKRKVICKTLRFVAHTNGAVLQNTDNPSKVEDPSKDPKYAEPAIDTLRAQKEEVLLMGPKGSGKTTLLYGWCLPGQETMAVPTQSFNVEMVYGVRNGQMLLMWDISDISRRRQFYHGTEDMYSIPSIEKELDLENIAADRKYDWATIRQDEPTTFQVALQKLCSLVYSK